MYILNDPGQLVKELYQLLHYFQYNSHVFVYE